MINVYKIIISAFMALFLCSCAGNNWSIPKPLGPEYLKPGERREIPSELSKYYRCTNGYPKICRGKATRYKGTISCYCP